MLIRDLLARPLVAVDADAPIHEIADKMKSHDVGLIPVLSQGRAVGIVTDRDLVLRVLAPISEPAMMTAWDVMTRDPVCINENATLEEATELMKERRLRRLVVVKNDGTPLGVASVSDLSRYSDRAAELIRILALKPAQERYRSMANTTILTL